MVLEYIHRQWLFAKAISEIVGFRVDFTEQGMQEDGMASMEGTMGDAMEPS